MIVASTQSGAQMRAVLWGSELSPYFLKTEALCRYRRLPVLRRPDGGGLFENIGLALRLKCAQVTRTVHRWPAIDPLDEYPLVPYLLTEDGGVHVDSSAIAGWLDQQAEQGGEPLIPTDPLLGFVCRLIDEALDEVGLYLAHHHRWVYSRNDNVAGARLAEEFRSLLPRSIRPLIATRFARRQTRRLPYLFSVAAADAPQPLPLDGLPHCPARTGFPATHTLLRQAWDELIDALKHALSKRAYLLGDRFTLADAAVYGQLAMNLSDPSASRHLRMRAPELGAWLDAIAAGRHVGSTGSVGLHADLAPLLEWVQSCFVPLMQANAAAYQRYRDQGQRRWNEGAFDRGEALFDLVWRDAPVRTVVKTFQVRVWRDLCAQAAALSDADLAGIPGIVPATWRA